MRLKDYIGIYGGEAGRKKFIDGVMKGKAVTIRNQAKIEPRKWRAIRVYGDRDDVEVVEM